jgi:large subunit ribosomal protein L29
MKSGDRLKKIRDMSVEELDRHVGSMNEQQLRLRFQWAMGQTEALKKLREVRKDRARVQTVIREREGGK